MYCDDCGSVLRMELREYMQRKQKLGTVLCIECRNGTPPAADLVQTRIV